MSTPFVDAGAEPESVSIHFIWFPCPRGGGFGVNLTYKTLVMARREGKAMTGSKAGSSPVGELGKLHLYERCSVR